MALAAVAALAGCDRRPDRGPVVVSVIGATPRFTGKPPATEPERILTGAVAAGLVAFDAAGQVEPGLAERWIVIDDGLRYIFRLRDLTWDDGRPLASAQVATILKRRLRDPASPVAPFVTAIDDVVAMTPQVIEVRLTRPRPDLLKLFAQPELAIARLKPPGGGGPFRIVGAASLLLRPAVDPALADEPDAAAPQPEDDVRVIGERAALAVERFRRHESDLLLGGSFVDWPVAAVADLAPANVRVDPAAGLFGLAVARREGVLATAPGRAAVAAAFDRTAIVASFAGGGVAVETLLPERLDSGAAPAQPEWAALLLTERRTAARRALATLPGPTTLRVALPDGPGATVLFRRLRFALGTVGLTSERVPMDAPDADLRLVDRVAPYDSARWYLQTACAPCGPEATAAIEAARLAPTLAARAEAIAAADAALTADAAFIPLTRPLRWSLVALRLGQFQGNPRGWHPLNHLRNERN